MNRQEFQMTLGFALLSLLIVPSSVWAQRMLRGTILTPAGEPAVEVTVKAFDEDDPATEGDDDPMGTATTNAQGRYSIGPYRDQHWDRYIGTTSWRPDIYIKVYQVIYGREVAVGKSSTHDDHPQRYDLTIDLQLKGIMGAITDSGGSPARGVLVKAFDEDDLSQDDRMNEVRTDANGAFLMTYEQKYECEQLLTTAECWDPPMPGTVSWRPDIYIEVHDTVRSRQIKINNKSATKPDVPHRNNVDLSETVPRHDDIDYTTWNPWEDRNVLQVLAYNIYMRPTSILKNGQAIRVPRIVTEILRDKYDVIVFSEAFADDLRQELRAALASKYPYDAMVPETNDPLKQDGGVKILSKWPIENGENLKGEYRVFGLPCLGWDCNAEKGVVYVRINKNGTPYHIFGTHVQADDAPTVLVEAGLTPRIVRKSQFQKIKDFIDKKNIRASEAVIIAGDLNVDKDRNPDEYAEMLQTLHAEHPSVVGYPYSVDGKLNDLIHDGGAQQLLDYVLYSKDHKQPIKLVAAPGRERQPDASNRVMFYRSDSGWREFETERYRWDISDHYPVFGKLRFGMVLKKYVVPPTLTVHPPAP